MRRLILAFFLTVQVSWTSGQIVLTIEGQEFNDVITGVSNGISIARSQPTTFTFRNNSVTSVNAQGYMLQAGDETPGPNNNNLDGEIIRGNKFVWNGTDVSSMTHAVFTGYNLNVVVKYNYLLRTPNGIQRKSDGMTNTSGGVAYNIINNPNVGVVAKGINGVCIFNNTFYSDKTSSETYRGLIDIESNTDDGLNAVSSGSKVFNNIFYTKNRVLNIKINNIECLSGFECDYNVYWCEAGEPIFDIEGMTKTFSQWQALGYDTHSVVINPDFINFTDFVPRERLDYGKDLGTEWQDGLSVDAVWGKTDPKTTNQNGTWQVGARIYNSSETKINIYPNPATSFIHIVNASPEILYQVVKIYDNSGRVLLTDSIKQGLNTIEIPVHFSTGIYSVSLEAYNQKIYVRKILIIN
jgi:hypothetical protein